MHRQAQQAEESGQLLQPEIPHRPQGPGEQAEKQRGAPGHAQQDKAPQLPVGLAEDEEKNGDTHRVAVQQIQNRRQPGAAQPQRPDQVVQHPQGRTQHNGQEKLPQLAGNLNPHHSAEQAAEKAALADGAILIGNGVDPAIHKQFAAF